MYQIAGWLALGHAYKYSNTDINIIFRLVHMTIT